jgi:transposase
MELSAEEAAELVARAKANALKPGDSEIIKALVDSHILLSQAIDNKSVSINRLLKMLFGSKTEKTKNIVKKSETDQSEKKEKKKDKEKKKPKGHGRNGADEYTGAKKVHLKHENLKHKDLCPDCETGKIYLAPEPGKVLRITGAAPLQATVYKPEKLRCNVCGRVFTANLPREAGDKKYDEEAAAMIACLRYGSGFPFNRLEALQQNMGMPLPSSTQWDISEKLADHIHPIYPALCRHGAQGDILHNDDTSVKILELMKENKENEGTGARTGIFTTGIVAIKDDRKIILFMSGRKHAGENLAEVLRERSACLDPPIQMCDALSRNSSEEFLTILSNCLSHGRRRFVDVSANFMEECEYVLETLGKVYKNDATAKKEKMTPVQRLKFHLRTRHSNKLHDQTLEKAHPVSESGESSAGQQHLRESIEKSHTSQEELAVLQN